MELSWMKYFVEVAKTESMTKAAANLYVSQPALSKTISLLEKELGVALFERTGRGMHLNACGAAYYEMIKKVLDGIEGAKKKVLDMAGKPEQVIRLLVGVFSMELLELIKKFRKCYPDIRIIMDTADSYIKEQEFDLAVVTAPYGMDKYNGIYLYEEELVLMFPPQMEIPQKESIDLIECHKYPFILPSEVNQNADLFCDMGKMVESLCIYAGFMPNVLMKTSNIETTIAYMESYNAVTILPKEFYQNRYSSRFQYRNIKEPKCSRKVYAVWKREKYMTDSFRILKDFICDYFET